MRNMSQTGHFILLRISDPRPHMSPSLDTYLYHRSAVKQQAHVGLDAKYFAATALRNSYCVWHARPTNVQYTCFMQRGLDLICTLQGGL